MDKPWKTLRVSHRLPTGRRLPTSSTALDLISIKSGKVKTISPERALAYSSPVAVQAAVTTATFTLYINNHGDSATKDQQGNWVHTHTGVGDEVIHVGDNLSDNSLAAILNKYFDGYQKNIFLDACHAGGFWGCTDPKEIGANYDDLNKLSNIALYAAAGEWDQAYFSKFSVDHYGESFWMQALEEAWLMPKSWDAEGLSKFLSARTLELAGRSLVTDPYFNTLALGDQILGDLSLISPFYAHSLDYDINAPLYSSVPEPGTLSLLALALVGLGASRRRRQ